MSITPSDCRLLIDYEDSVSIGADVPACCASISLHSCFGPLIGLLLVDCL